jgi:hypothetical protein
MPPSMREAWTLVSPRGWAGLALLLCACELPAQTLTTGAIAGSVLDPTGAAVAGATLTVTRLANGASRAVKTGASGNNYSVPLLDPGSYEVVVEAPGFTRQEISPVTVGLAETVTVNITLKVAAGRQSVRVVAPALLVGTDNPNTTTILDARTISDLPNPGMDMTYVANFAPGAVMNSTSQNGPNGPSSFSYPASGNVEFNGLPSVSNQFTIDGVDANDPFTNLNIVGASNLQLGLNAIQEVSINTNAYAADQGRLGAAQINYLTKSGSNRLHGNLFEIWNGSALNATDYFVNAFQFEPQAARPSKPRSNMNEFGGSIGGSILRDKLFFFTDLEGNRIILPVVGSATLPSKVYQQYVLSQLPLGGCDYELSDCTNPSTAIVYPSESAELPLYQTMFKLYGNVSGVPQPIPGCPLNADGNVLPIPSPSNPSAAVPAGDGCVSFRVFPVSPHTRETLWTVKIDHNVNSRNTVWYRFQMDNGRQGFYIDPVNPIFDIRWPAPQRSASASWVHTFSPVLVNQFTPGFAWNSAIVQPANFAQLLHTFPIVLYPSSFSNIGGVDDAFPSGRALTEYELVDNLSWVKGKNLLKFGENFRRVLISDHDFGLQTVPDAFMCSFSEFTYGAACSTFQSFPKSLDEPFGLVNLDLHAMDTAKLTPKFTLTVGLRATWNSDPVNQHGQVSRLRESWDTLSHDVNRPPHEDIVTGLSKVFSSTPLLVWQPRAALAYQLMPKTVVRAGFGVFSDLLPGQLGEITAMNPPYLNGFTGGLGGPVGGLGIAPGVPGSAIDVLAAANQQALATFASQLSCRSPNAEPNNCVPPFRMFAVPDHMKYPYFMQWSFGIQRELAANWGLMVQYVGTRSVQSAYEIIANGYTTICGGCFRPLSSKIPDARFGDVQQLLSGANGNYHGLQITGKKRMSRGLQFEMNYTWSHCLDTASNGGLIAFGGPAVLRTTGELGRYYGPCDYDLRHALNGFYVYQLPFHARDRALNKVVSGWQVSGSLILHTGLPVSMRDILRDVAFHNAIINTFPNLIPGQPLYHRQAIAGITPPGEVQWLNPYAFSSAVDTTTQKCVPASSNFQAAIAGEGINPQLCQFGNLQRNFARAPGFRWADFSVSRRFKLTEGASLNLDTQFFNVFNHPNFGPPSVVAGIPGRVSTLYGVGAIQSTASPPTGLLGANLGGDTSVRMIAFRARIEF